MSRSLCKTRLSGPVIDSSSVLIRSACFSLERDGSAGKEGFDITTVERTRDTREEDG